MLVTGATGFIGSHLVRALRADGVPLTALVRSASDATSLDRLGARVVRADLRDPRSVRDAMAGCSVVYHLAAATSRVAAHSAAEYHNSNVHLTATILAAAVAAGVDRVVYSSSSGVYGKLSQCPMPEDGPLRPNTRYRRSKLAAERLVWPYLDSNQPTIVIARPAIVYGPGAANWLPLVDDIRRGRIRVLGDLTHPYHVTYVDDIVSGLRCCGSAAAGGIFNLAAVVAPTLGEFLEAIALELGVGFAPRRLPAWPFAWAAGVLAPPLRIAGWEPRWLGRVALFTEPRAYDITRARTQLGYAPAVTLREGIRRTVQWSRRYGHEHVPDVVA